MKLVEDPLTLSRLLKKAKGRGQKIALAGRTGRVRTPMLHFRVLRMPSGKPFDPLRILPR